MVKERHRYFKKKNNDFNQSQFAMKRPIEVTNDLVMARKTLQMTKNTMVKQYYLKNSGLRSGATSKDGKPQMSSSYSVNLRKPILKQTIHGKITQEQQYHIKHPNTKICLKNQGMSDITDIFTQFMKERQVAPLKGLQLQLSRNRFFKQYSAGPHMRHHPVQLTNSGRDEAPQAQCGHSHPEGVARLSSSEKGG